MPTYNAPGGTPVRSLSSRDQRNRSARQNLNAARGASTGTGVVSNIVGTAFRITRATVDRYGRYMNNRVHVDSVHAPPDIPSVGRTIAGATWDETVERSMARSSDIRRSGEMTESRYYRNLAQAARQPRERRQPPNAVPSRTRPGVMITRPQAAENPAPSEGALGAGVQAAARELQVAVADENAVEDEFARDLVDENIQRVSSQDIYRGPYPADPLFDPAFVNQIETDVNSYEWRRFLIPQGLGNVANRRRVTQILSNYETAVRTQPTIGTEGPYATYRQNILDSLHYLLNPERGGDLDDEGNPIDTWGDMPEWRLADAGFSVAGLRPGDPDFWSKVGARNRWKPLKTADGEITRREKWARENIRSLPPNFAIDRTPRFDRNDLLLDGPIPIDAAVRDSEAYGTFKNKHENEIFLTPLSRNEYEAILQATNQDIPLPDEDLGATQFGHKMPGILKDSFFTAAPLHVNFLLNRVSKLKNEASKEIRNNLPMYRTYLNSALTRIKNAATQEQQLGVADDVVNLFYTINDIIDRTTNQRHLEPGQSGELYRVPVDIHWYTLYETDDEARANEEKTRISEMMYWADGLVAAIKPYYNTIGDGPGKEFAPPDRRFTYEMSSVYPFVKQAMNEKGDLLFDPDLRPVPYKEYEDLDDYVARTMERRWSGNLTEREVMSVAKTLTKYAQSKGNFKELYEELGELYGEIVGDDGEDQNYDLNNISGTPVEDGVASNSVPREAQSTQDEVNGAERELGTSDSFGAESLDAAGRNRRLLENESSDWEQAENQRRRESYMNRAERYERGETATAPSTLRNVDEASTESTYESTEEPPAPANLEETLAARTLGMQSTIEGLLRDAGVPRDVANRLTASVTNLTVQGLQQLIPAKPNPFEKRDIQPTQVDEIRQPERNPLETHPFSLSQQAPVDGAGEYLIDGRRVVPGDMIGLRAPGTNPANRVIVRAGQGEIGTRADVTADNTTMRESEVGLAPSNPPAREISPPMTLGELERSPERQQDLAREIHLSASDRTGLHGNALQDAAETVAAVVDMAIAVTQLSRDELPPQDQGSVPPSRNTPDDISTPRTSTRDEFNQVFAEAGVRPKLGISSQGYHANINPVHYEGSLSHISRSAGPGDTVSDGYTFPNGITLRGRIPEVVNPTVASIRKPLVPLGTGLGNGERLEAPSSATTSPSMLNQDSMTTLGPESSSSSSSSSSSVIPLPRRSRAEPVSGGVQTTLSRNDIVEHRIFAETLDNLANAATLLDEYAGLVGSLTGVGRQNNQEHEEYMKGIREEFKGVLAGVKTAVSQSLSQADLLQTETDARMSVLESAWKSSLGLISRLRDSQSGMSKRAVSWARGIFRYEMDNLRKRVVADLANEAAQKEHQRKLEILKEKKTLRELELEKARSRQHSQHDHAMDMQVLQEELRQEGASFDAELEYDKRKAFRMQDDVQARVQAGKVAGARHMLHEAQLDLMSRLLGANNPAATVVAFKMLSGYVRNLMSMGPEEFAAARPDEIINMFDQGGIERLVTALTQPNQSPVESTLARRIADLENTTRSFIQMVSQRTAHVGAAQAYHPPRRVFVGRDGLAHQGKRYQKRGRTRYTRGPRRLPPRTATGRFKSPSRGVKRVKK